MEGGGGAGFELDGFTDNVDVDCTSPSPHRIASWGLLGGATHRPQPSARVAACYVEDTVSKVHGGNFRPAELAKRAAAVVEAAARGGDETATGGAELARRAAEAEARAEARNGSTVTAADVDARCAVVRGVASVSDSERPRAR